MKAGDVVWFVVSAAEWPRQEVRAGVFRAIELVGEDRIKQVVVEDTHTGQWWRLDKGRVFHSYDDALAFAQVVANVADECYNAKKEAIRK